VGQQLDGQQQGQPVARIGCKVSSGATEMLAVSDMAMAAQNDTHTTGAFSVAERR
jgi:hypothetical protein